MKTQLEVPADRLCNAVTLFVSQLSERFDYFLYFIFYRWSIARNLVNDLKNIIIESLLKASL